MKKFFVIATHWDEHKKDQVKYIAGEFSDFVNADLFKKAYNEHYTEKTTLQSMLTTDEPEPTSMPFDLVEQLIADAAQIWDFADENQKRRIMQSLIKRIVLTDDDVKIEWAF